MYIKEPQLTGLHYDKTAYIANVVESMRPGEYHLRDRTHDDSCLMGYPGYLAGNKSKSVVDVDVESELHGLNYIISRFPQPRQALPKQDKKQKKCLQQLVSENTRDLKQCNNLPHFNRFEPVLFLDPQKQLQSNSYIGRQTRLNKKKSM